MFGIISDNKLKKGRIIFEMAWDYIAGVLILCFRIMLRGDEHYNLLLQLIYFYY